MITMTGSAPGAAVGPSRPGPSLSAIRARRLLAGGLAGAHVAALTCVGVFLVRDGLAGLASAGLAAALVMLFYTVGQWVQVRVADAPAKTVFRASVVSYIARVTALGGLLFGYLATTAGSVGDDSVRLLAAPVIITAIATVIGWLAGEITVFSRLRIPNFDEPAEGGA